MQRLAAKSCIFVSCVPETSFEAARSTASWSCIVLPGSETRYSSGAASKLGKKAYFKRSLFQRGKEGFALVHLSV